MRLLFLVAVLAMAAPAAAHAQARALRLMTYNLNWGNPDPRTALDAIAKADVDVVLLQEVDDGWKQLLETHFAKHYAHHIYRVHARRAGGLAVLSKLPVTAEEVHDAPAGGWFPAQRLVIESTFGALQILNVHLRPAVDGGNWVKGFLTTPPLRLREIETYWKKLARELPTIIAGDFNEDPISGKAIDFLKKQGLARIVTKGPTTWRYVVTNRGKKSDLLKLDIDHVMVDGALRGHSGEVIDAGHSDHRPVVVTIEPKS